jgi:hypothetical protein
MRLRSVICTAVGLAVLGSAPAAHAGTVSIDSTFDEFHPSEPVATFLNYADDAAEQNDLTVTYDDGHWLFHDANAPMQTRNCTVVDEHTVDCNAGEGPVSGDPTFLGLNGVDIELGDGDDHVSTGPLSPRVRSLVRGGTGKDTIAVASTNAYIGPFVYGQSGPDTLTGSASGDAFDGGSGNDTLVGAGGDDQLTGGRGADDLSGGDGDDTLLDGSPAAEADHYDGGTGIDRVDYDGRQAGVTIDLGAGTSSDGDVLVGMENARGGNGPDSLVGDAGPNGLTGGDGADTFKGGDGDDAIDSEDGKKAGRAELVHCGIGKDTVAGRDTGDRLARDCEQAAVRGDLDIALPNLVLQPLTLSARRLTGLAIACTPEALPKGCRGTVTAQVRRGKRLVTVGQAKVIAKPGQTVAAPIKLVSGAPDKLQRDGLHKLVIKVRLDVRERPPFVDPEPDRTVHLRDAATTFALR